MNVPRRMGRPERRKAALSGKSATPNMVAATNQSRHPHGALLFYMGTPPRPTDPGEPFTKLRKEALAGESEDGVFVECSADPEADPDDREQWLVLTRWRDEDAFQAWVESPSFAEGHRSAVERAGGEAPKPVSTHSEVWSYEIAGGSQPG